MADRLDNYEKRPSGMDTYLSMYGWHFSKKMAQFAADKFMDSVSILEPEIFSNLTKETEISQKSNGYDAQYLFAKFRHICPDYSEIQVVGLVNRLCKNNYPTAAFTDFYADCVANGIAIIWEDML